MNTKINIGFLGLLQLTFIILKLTNTISWSWWYVMMPYGLPALLGIIFAIITITIHLKDKARAKAEMKRVKKKVSERKKRRSK